MANRIKLPGILGSAAEQVGVSALAKAVGTTPRTLYNWATNHSPTPAIPALRIAELCRQLGLEALRYRSPESGGADLADIPSDFILSTPQGWIHEPGTGHGPSRYLGVVEDPVPAPAAPAQPKGSVSAETLKELVSRIVEAVAPVRIILFGSAARGDMGPDSDLDVLVVMPDGAHRRETAAAVYRSLRRFPYPKDIVVATVSDLVEYGDSLGLVYRQAIREGRELYHAA
jgi:predicted nucleotidyltransferase